MTVIFYPEQVGSFTSPVTIPVIFENTVTFDDAVTYNAGFTITGSLNIPGDLTVSGAATFTNVDIAQASTSGIPLVVTDTAASVTDSVVAGFFYPNMTVDFRNLSLYMGLSETDCGKIEIWRDTATDYHYRIFPNIEDNTYFFVTESGLLGFQYLNSTKLEMESATDTILTLESTNDAQFVALSSTNAQFVATTTQSTGSVPFLGLAPNLADNTLLSLDLGQTTTRGSRVAYLKVGSNDYARIYPSLINTTSYMEFGVSGFSFYINNVKLFEIVNSGCYILNNNGGTGDSTAPFLAGYNSYTPTVAQLSGTTATSVSNLYSNWFRICNNVTIYFQIRVEQGSVAGAESQTYSISLPFTNTFANNVEGAGCANMIGGVNGYAVCESRALNSDILVTVRTDGPGSGACILAGHFSYEVL